MQCGLVELRVDRRGRLIESRAHARVGAHSARQIRDTAQLGQKLAHGHSSNGSPSRYKHWYKHARQRP